MKKFRSKWFRIAVEGATTDGRNIERDWIEQMAAQYDPNTYGARINCEHIKWAWPAGEFGAYGDVLACKAEEIDINGQKKLALFAQLEPNQALLELNKQRQKVYTSVEIDPKFADTGKAYLVGLAITDSPASLGTEALSFSAKNGTLASRKTNPDTLFSAAEEGTLEFEEYEDKPSVGAALFTKVKELLKGKEARTQAEFGQVGEAVEAIAEHSRDLGEQLGVQKKQTQQLASQLDKVTKELADLKSTLDSTRDHSQQQRPPVTGGGSVALTDC
ncbi:phage capsid protein [Pseudomonas aeruginosa]|uniref:GPO family capsid scaffolding protein n=1 Tax=Pseudomonas aeruginosa TaxID=287 RepID=UPI000F52D7AF|nr:GPO family capsid scaffolding protein [Pseudomonas aeruginosa]MBG7580823.1 GPO family capsid scaffolding protein [Pseudomonas aeruginosa]MBW6386417.1 GPO family capsid scaffolding protein [Pseudomonas aeruginosa]MBX5895390.1 GPO family capsid scaffolding protein [Pseudomonas aeruginosa]RPS36365.1 phage capsid protein [Pseudomonas aeruginosa]HBP6410074.1 GPO family capsid scaffolding protein [Pseudomonas aeruginosa]